MNWQVIQGDCVEVMAGLEPGSFDLVLTDPPYGLEFMGKEWDKLTEHTSPTANGKYPKSRNTSGYRYSECDGFKQQDWHYQWAKAALRVLKPGGSLVAFGGTRTHHRLMCAIEDAGFEIRDCLCWLFGSGFPKSLSIEKSVRQRLGPDGFCRCAANTHSIENTSPGQATDDRTDTAETSGDDGRTSVGAGRSTQTPSSSRPGCLLDFGSDDAHALSLSAGGQASSPPQGYAQGHSHFDGHGDARAGAPSHNPSPARRSDHRANTDSSRASDFALGERSGESNRPADTCESDDHTSGSCQDVSRTKYSTGFPLCQVCGKPIVETWAGYGTALKPAYEMIVWAMKPLDGTFAHNAEKWGVAGVNIEAGRIAGAVPQTTQGASSRIYGGGNGLRPNGKQDSNPSPSGRFPANLLLDEAAAVMLDEQSGYSSSSSRPADKGGTGVCYTVPHPKPGIRGHDDGGGASRFFYTAKASRAERERGLEDMPLVSGAERSGRKPGTAGLMDADRPNCEGGNPYAGATTNPARNHHPTVKPLALMRYLLKLFDTPTGGKVLDPFGGSGSTAVAAVQLGRDCTIIEREAEYCKIAEARISAAARQQRLDL